jgi:HK97 family phage portal protein
MHFEMRLFGRTIELQTKALQLSPLSSRGHSSWYPWGVIRESFTGAWQQNVDLRADTVLTNPTLFAVVTLVAADVAKLGIRLVEQDSDGVWTPIESPAFSPVLRKPNKHQIIIEFIEQWMISKLTQGNTYVLLQRDNRKVVVAMYVLDPSRVTPLVTPSGDLYYQLKRDDLSQLATDSVTVPASEIIHDRMVCLYHPLIGVTPIYACGAAALQGLTIQNRSTQFFSNGSQPGAIITAPLGISDAQADALKLKWETDFAGDNSGKIAVIGGELKFTQLAQTAVDSQLIEQMHWGDERICSAYHVPPYMVGVGPPPPYANVEPLLQAYYSQCLQSHLTKLELCLDKGLGIADKVDGKQYGTEFDIDDLIWMNAEARGSAAKNGIGGPLSPNEARKKFYGIGPVKGGEVPILQQQYWPLDQLAERAIPAIPAATGEPPPPPDEDEGDDAEMEAASFASQVLQKTLEGLHAA